MKQDKTKEKINTDGICVGQVLKNYKELCRELGIVEKKSGSKTYQLKEIERYIEYQKQGNKFIITKIYDEPLFKKSNSVYKELIYSCLIAILHKNRNSKNFFITKSKLLEQLGFVNKNFAECRAAVKAVADHLNVDEVFLLDFFKANQDRINTVFQYHLDRFIEETNCCTVDKEVIRICENIPNFIGIDKDDIGEKHRFAKSKEIEKIEKCEKEVLEFLKVRKKSDLHMKNLWIVFVNECNERLKKNNDFKFLNYYYKVYLFKIDKLRIENLYKNLTEKKISALSTAINKASKQSALDSIETRKANALKRLQEDMYKDYQNYLKEHDRALIRKEVLKENKSCVSKLVSNQAKRIDVKEVKKKYEKKCKNKFSDDLELNPNIENDALQSAIDNIPF